MATVIRRGNSFLFRASDGYDSDHKQIKYNFTWKADPGMNEKQILAEAARQAALFEERVKGGRVVDGNIKFANFVKIWLTGYAEKQLAPKTVHRYRQLLVRINDSIGHIRMDRLQPNHLMALYGNLAADGVRSGRKYNALPGLSERIDATAAKRSDFARIAKLAPNTIRAACESMPVSEKAMRGICAALSAKPSELFAPVEGDYRLSDRTVLHHHRLISSILTTAVEWQIIYSNPAERVKSPKVERSESRYLDENQAKRVIEMLQAEPIQYRTMITLLIYSGIRRGELCGLKWDDIDFNANMIRVNRSTQYLPDRGIFDKDTKTQSSIRSIKLSSIAFKLLKEYKAWQDAEIKSMGDMWVNTDRLFTKHNGEPMHPDTITQWFEQFIKRHDLPPVSIHSLRHTNATLLIAGGTDIRTVSSRLGHSQASTTTDIYAHAIKSADEAAAKTIENLLDPMKKRSGHKKTKQGA